MRSSRSRGKRASASSTSNSVSARGISVAGVTVQVEAPEAAAAGEVRDRFAGDATRDQRLETRDQCRVGDVVAVRIQPAPRFAQGMREQPLRVDRIDPRTRLAQQCIQAVVFGMVIPAS